MLGRGEPDLQELMLISTHLSPCLSLITVPLFRTIASQSFRSSSDDFREMKATDTKSGYLVQVKEKVLGCIASNYDQLYPSRKDFTNNQKTCEYKFLNSSRL